VFHNILSVNTNYCPKQHQKFDLHKGAVRVHCDVWTEFFCNIFRVSFYFSALRWLRLLVAGISQWKPRVDPRSLQVRLLWWSKRHWVRFFCKLIYFSPTRVLFANAQYTFYLHVALTRRNISLLS